MKTLDGKYVIVTQSRHTGPHQKQSDGFTVIKDGRTDRLDAAGCEWTSHFEWIDDTHVKMTSTIDPRFAADAFTLMGPDGLPSTEAQSYETVLTATIQDGLLTLRGVVGHGPEKVTLTLRQVPPAA